MKPYRPVGNAELHPCPKADVPEPMSQSRCPRADVPEPINLHVLTNATVLSLLTMFSLVMFSLTMFSLTMSSLVMFSLTMSSANSNNTFC